MVQNLGYEAQCIKEQNNALWQIYTKQVCCKTDSAANENEIKETNLATEHMDRMVGKANRIPSMLKRTFESSETGLWKDLYVSLV